MKVIFTGGGTAGHAMVNTILIPYLQQKDCLVSYIGSTAGMEKEMIHDFDHVKYYGISTGKLRRYFSWKNFTDVFRTAKGFFEAYRILKEEKPQLIYSSGGYVSVPVVWAASVQKIPVILRETDYTTGLANKLCMPFAKKMYVTFPDSAKNTQSICCSYDGMIIRPQLYHYEFLPTTFINMQKPVCLVMGGSCGAAEINDLIWKNIDILTQRYNILHLCGKGNYNGKIPDTDSYQQLEFVKDMGTLYHLADVVVTRSGSNAIVENLLLGKRMVCIPLSNSSSRGEQTRNAKFAERNGTAVLAPRCGISNLLNAIQSALTRPKNDAYKTSKRQLIARIEKHTQSIYDLAFEQLKREIEKHLKYGKKINFNNLSAYELSIFEELSANYEL